MEEKEERAREAVRQGTAALEICTKWRRTLYTHKPPELKGSLWVYNLRRAGAAEPTARGGLELVMVEPGVLHVGQLGAVPVQGRVKAHTRVVRTAARRNAFRCTRRKETPKKAKPI